jgi:hypothetical protein
MRGCKISGVKTRKEGLAVGVESDWRDSEKMKEREVRRWDRKDGKGGGSRLLIEYAGLGKMYRDT